MDMGKLLLEVKMDPYIAEIKECLATLRERGHVRIKVLDDRLDTLSYATEGSAGVDVRACVTEDTFVHPGETKLIPLGFAMALPSDCAALLLPRSGLGHKSGIVLGNLVGLIDHDYRGQVFASVWNRNSDGEAFRVSPMDRIAQMIIVPVKRPEYVVVEDLDETERGAGGFGHSGV